MASIVSKKTRLPKDYLAKVPAENLQFKAIAADELPFEFMMNALRLNDGVEANLYTARTGLNLDDLQDILNTLRQRQLLQDDPKRLACTAQGHVFLNSVLEAFL